MRYELSYLPDDISVEAGVMITDMVTTGFHGAELADIQLEILLLQWVWVL